MVTPGNDAGRFPSDPLHHQWAAHIDRLQWSAMILDAEWRLQWASPQLREFIKDHGRFDTTELGYGLHVVEAFMKPAWINTVHPDSQAEMFLELAPFMLTDLQQRGRDPLEIIPEPFAQLVGQVEPTEIPSSWSTSFLYVDRLADTELPAYRVNVFFIRMNGDNGRPSGWLIFFFMGIRPNLLALLGRGDERMYERMASLVEPGPRQAAILFCDLHGSGVLSRRLPSVGYFKLVRRLWTGIDAAVADNAGIIGKHAGDGASAYFLVDDCGGPSEAAAAALKTARRVHEVSESVFDGDADSPCFMKVGVHWGGSLFMGQLVPGGRLDVTALGDEVNEAARIQEAADRGETLASKPLLERLSDDAAAALGLDPEKLAYRQLVDVAPHLDKVVRDAGALAVSRF